MHIIASVFAATFQLAATGPQRVPVNVALVQVLETRDAAAMIVRIPDGRDMILLPVGATSEHFRDAVKKYQESYRQKPTVAKRQQFAVPKASQVRSSARQESDKSFVRQLAVARPQATAGFGKVPMITIWVLVGSSP